MIATTDNFAQQLDRFSERLLAGFRLLLVVGLTATLGLTGNVHHEHEFMISLVGLSAIAALSLLFGYVLDVRWWTPWFLGTLDVALLIHCLWLVSTDVANSNYTTLAVPGTSLIFAYLAMAAIRNRPFLVLYIGTLFIAGWLLVWLGAAPSDRSIAAHPDTMWSTGEIARIAIVAMVAGVLFLAAFQSRRLIGTLVSEVQLRARFAQYLPAPVATALANGEDVLEAHNREVAVLFVDIRRFTRMAEAINPGDVAELLTTYRHRVSRCVTIHGGYVDKFIGDGLMAVFGAPLQGAQDAQNALDCGFSI